jgi:hypothetical protein
MNDLEREVGSWGAALEEARRAHFLRSVAFSMIVVADSSRLRYLIVIEQIQLQKWQNREQSHTPTPLR